MMGYLIFAVLGFITIYDFSSNTTYGHLVEQQAKILYDNANIASYQYSLNKIEKDNSNYEFISLIRTMSRTLDSQVWVVGTDGKLLIDSTQYFYEDKTIANFDPAYFGKNYYKIGNFFGYFNYDVLTVSIPITEGYVTLGYVIIHTSLDIIKEQTSSIIGTMYITFGIILILSLIIIIIFTIFVYKPIRRISIAANEYAKGNFTYEGLAIKSENEIGRLASSLNFMANELNALDEDQRKFIANISHDFRSPLTSIKGYVEAMKDGTIPMDMQGKYLDTVLFETERLNKLTSSLLTLNAWDNKVNRLNLSDFDINAVIKNIIQTFEGVCTKKKITFDIHFGDKTYFVSADLSKIQQVLYNLIDNAAKFSYQNSEIKISVYDKYEKVFVSIKDFGIGIPRDNLNKIWDRFFKTDSSRGRDKTGTGLGLSITKEIIQSHNENINVISTQGVGTEFIFTLQKAKKKA